MKLIATALIILLASCSAVAPAAQNGPKTRDNQISLYVGQRTLGDDDFWEPLEKQSTFGIGYVHEPADSRLGFEVGIMSSSDDTTLGGFDIEASTTELYGGIRKTFGQDVARPYIGGGLSYINAEGEISGLGSEDDSSIALYVHGGIGFQLTDVFVIGVDLRFLFGSDIALEGFVDTDVDYTQVALFAGFGF